MPSREMRSTRVFASRVLRSGRKLMTEQSEGRNHRKLHDGERDCIELVNKSSEGGNSRDEIMNVQQEDCDMGLIVEHVVAKSVSEGVMGLQDEERFRIVYNRKRKRSELTSKGLFGDKMFGIKYARRQWRKKPRLNGTFELVVSAYELSRDSTYWVTCFLTSVLSYMTKVRLDARTLSAFVFSKPIFDSYYSRGVLFLKDSNSLRSPGFCVISGSRSLMPIFSVDFSAIPFCFMRMHTSIYIRSLRFLCFDLDSQCVHEKEEKPVNILDVTMESSSETLFNGEDHSDFVPMVSATENPFDGGDHSNFVPVASVTETPFNRGDHSDFVPVASANDNSGKRSSSSTKRTSHLRNVQLRNIQKRRTSLRLKKNRSTSSNRVKRDGRSLSADFRRIMHGSTQFSATAPRRMLRSSSPNKESPISSPNAIKSDLGSLMQGVSTSICSANLLVTEQEKCYREGVAITIECSITKQFCLAIKKNGINRYTLAAEKVMRPPTINHFNHATIWAVDESWKLEFPDKQDWLVFKELYKECSDQNVKASAANAIPIPKVQEVSYLYDSDFVPFVRPDSYITVKDDELTRALLKMGANYDMDSEDEKWLKNFNEELFVAGELQQLTPDRFEWIIDAIEKSIHCTGDENSIVQTRDDNFMPTEPVRSYWIKKRKQKHSSFVRTFQLYQPTRKDPVTRRDRRDPVIARAVLRQKRSLKRQKRLGGRSKPQPQAIAEETVVAEEHDSQQQKRSIEIVQKAEEHDAQQQKRNTAIVQKAEEHDAQQLKRNIVIMQKAEEYDAQEQKRNLAIVQNAKASADYLEEVAARKRLRAQKLMERADLATYKAVVALRIAEAAAQVTESESLSGIASYFLN